MILAESAGAPERIRTPNPQIRSLVLYPVELRAPRAGPGWVRLNEGANLQASPADSKDAVVARKRESGLWV